MKSTKKRIDLDWNKLVGFNQVKTSAKQNAKAALAAKIGGKVGAKPPAD